MTFQSHHIPAKRLKQPAIEQGSHPGWKNGETIFESGNFDQTGIVREFYPKYWKSMEND